MSAPESLCHFLFRHPSALSFVYSRISFLYNLYFQHDCLPFVGYADSLYSFSSNKSHHNRLLPASDKEGHFVFQPVRQTVPAPVPHAAPYGCLPVPQAAAAGDFSAAHREDLQTHCAGSGFPVDALPPAHIGSDVPLLPRLPHPDRHILLPYSLPSAPYAELLQN